MAALAGLYSTRFYPASMQVPGSVDISQGSVRNPDIPAAYGGDVGTSGNLPALWWLGILIVLIALRVIYEYV